MSLVGYAILNATRKFDRHDNLFSTANFQSALSELSRSRPMITPQQAEIILLSVSSVVREGNNSCHWRLVG